ncbi:hypothetical protein KEM55_004914 [Ascosphaera atra]|nr:hypothetical protein KEM55_004914 [Ascosphaera atra]
MDATTPREAVLEAFVRFRDELDEHHDRRERVIKTSRDITALSKKIIFALQRVRTLGKPLAPKILQETDSKLKQITDLFASIAPDLTGINGHRYQWQISPGIQEYIEAASFKHYIETKQLITIEEIRSRLPGILVTDSDYVLGLFDLTGEMMRFAITAVAAGEGASSSQDEATGDNDIMKRGTLGPVPAQILHDMRELRYLFERLTIPRGHNLKKQFYQKLDVTCSSVSKVENAAYEVLVRGSEMPSGWTPDTSGPAMEVEG